MPHKRAPPDLTQASITAGNAVSQSKLFDLTVETCALVGKLVEYSELAALARTSKRGYELFNPVLYSRINVPPASFEVMFTLACTPRLVELVQELRFDSGKARQYGAVAVARRRQNLKEGFKLFAHRIGHLSAEADTVLRLLSSTTHLTTLQWNSPRLPRELMSPSKQAFPCLRNLSICVISELKRLGEVEKSDLRFLALSTLESLEYDETADRAVRKQPADKRTTQIASALRLIEPGNSLLKAFTLRLNFRTENDWDDDEDSSDADDKDTSSGPANSAAESLEAALSGLRLPRLTTLHLNVKLYSKSDSNLNFHPFLEAHPQLRDVEGSFVTSNIDDSCLRELEVFKGTTDACSAILNGKRPVKSLFIILRGPYLGHSGVDRTDDDQEARDEEILTKLKNTPTLKRLFLNGKQESTYVPRIVQACPHLTHLELIVTGDMHGLFSALKGLHELQNLKVTISIDYDELSEAEEEAELDSDEEEEEAEDAAESYANTYSPVKCKTAVERLLVPSVPALKDVEVRVLIWGPPNDYPDDHPEAGEQEAIFSPKYVFEIQRDNGTASVSCTSHVL